MALLVVGAMGMTACGSSSDNASPSVARADASTPASSDVPGEVGEAELDKWRPSCWRCRAISRRRTAISGWGSNGPCHPCPGSRPRWVRPKQPMRRYQKRRRRSSSRASNGLDAALTRLSKAQHQQQTRHRKGIFGGPILVILGSTQWSRNERRQAWAKRSRGPRRDHVGGEPREGVDLDG